MGIPNVIILLTETERLSYERYSTIKAAVVIPNAIDVSVYEHVKFKTFENSKLVFGYIGRLADDKGISESVRALKLLQDREGYSVKYLIAGSGPSEQFLKDLVSELGLDDSIEFMAPIFGDEKTKFWEKIDIFLFPTYHREGLPYTILEAIASATPVITARVGGIPDVIREEIHGVFVDPHNPEDIANAVHALNNNRDKLRAMSVNAKERALEYYTIKRLSDQFRSVFNMVVVN